MLITHASYRDMACILALQKLAYRSEADRYQDETLPPMVQTIEALQEAFKRLVILKAVMDDVIVGSVRAHAEGDTCFIGRLIVHPDFQNQGIGQILMHQIENAFSHVKRFELFTGHKSDGPLHIYRKLGYKRFKEKKLATHTLVFLEKETR